MKNRENHPKVVLSLYIVHCPFVTFLGHPPSSLFLGIVGLYGLGLDDD